MNRILKLYSQVFLLEARKVLAYRAEFWVNYVFSVIFQLTIAYFLWQSVFDYTGKSVIGGFSFHGMIFYYLLVRFLDLVLGTKDYEGEVASEIYQGTLNRFLVFPINFFSYKLVSRMSISALKGGQGSLAIFLFVLIFGWPPEAQFHFALLASGVLNLFLAFAFVYTLGFLIQLVAFWADNVWSLMVALRFILRFLGGAYLPLSLFPDEVRGTLAWLPFSAVIWGPISSLMGSLTLSQSLTHSFNLLIWTLFTLVVTGFVWRAGMRRYSGVGI